MFELYIDPKILLYRFSLAVSWLIPRMVPFFLVMGLECFRCFQQERLVI